MARSLRTKIWRSFSAHIFVKSGSIHVKPRPNDHRPILHISTSSENASFCDICP